MEIKINKFYHIKINRKGLHLDYNAKINKIENNEYYIKTDNGECLHFYFYEIISTKEIPSFEGKQKIWKISNKKKKIPSVY